MLYRDFGSQRKLSRQYDPLEDIGGMPALEALLNHRDELSRKALDHLERRADILYGQTLREKLDFYPARSPGAPIIVFIHGGYWIDTRITRAQFSWVAEPFVQHGFNVAIIDYEVGPVVTIDEIVRECRAALVWLHKNGAAEGADPSRIYLVGNSVGGHLLAMAVLTDWERRYGLSGDMIKGGCAISGVYDLEPIPFTWIQPMLQLEWGEVRRNSPKLHVKGGMPPLLFSWGTSETAEFQRQSSDFAEQWKAAGNSSRIFIQPGGDHFTVMDGFQSADSDLFKEILNHIGECGMATAGS